MSLCRGFALTILSLFALAAGPSQGQAPVLSPSRLTSWRPELAQDGPAPRTLASTALDPARHGTRSHAGTGLLIGGIVGVAATGAFLALFCSDPDTSCGADEVGRAAVVFAPPPAALGALIGSLIHTED